MKAITISVVHNGYLVQGYPPARSYSCAEPPLAEFLYVFTDIEELKRQLEKLLADSESVTPEGRI